MKILCVLGKHNYADPARGEGYEHANFVPALSDLGNEVQVFDSLSRTSYRSFAELNELFLARVDQFQPDLIFCVLMHYELWTETLDLARARASPLLLNWGT